MRIAENVEALELPMNLMGQGTVIYPALLWDSDGSDIGASWHASPLRSR